MEYLRNNFIQCNKAGALSFKHFIVLYDKYLRNVNILTASDLRGIVVLNRVLKLKDLVFFGIICVTPIAPLPPFGIAQSLSGGHAALIILIAMLAMLPTAISYGRMAVLYPSAGSAFTYVTNGLNPHVGLLAGWTICLDYLMIPIANVIYCSTTMTRVIEVVPYSAWAIGFAVLSTWLNLRGVRTGARTNQILMFIMVTVLAAFIICAIRFVTATSGSDGLMSTLPFYNPTSFDVKQIREATAFAVLTYIGFDAVTTLSEEVENPRRNVALATVLVCFFTGISGVALVYLAQLVWPDYTSFTNLDTAFMDVMYRIGGSTLFSIFAVVLILAQFGSALTGQAGGSRVLFGMSRAGVLPQPFFAHIDEQRQLPIYNILLIGVFTLIGALIFDFQRAAELLNFGAFFAFMGVNLAVIKSYFFMRAEQQRNFIIDFFIPALGFILCFTIWISLPMSAKYVGFTWLALGITYKVVQTRYIQD
jgi:putrescine importer